MKDFLFNDFLYYPYSRFFTLEENISYTFPKSFMHLSKKIKLNKESKEEIFALLISFDPTVI